MSAEAGWYTPLLLAMDLERSVEFYQRLGFEVIDSDGCRPLGWARLHCRGGALMLLRAETPMKPADQAVLFVLYSADLAGLREQLRASGVAVSEIRHPEHAPSGEMTLTDPDGYRLSVIHWGEQEHTAWLNRIGRESI